MTTAFSLAPDCTEKPSTSGSRPTSRGRTDTTASHLRVIDPPAPDTRNLRVEQLIKDHIEVARSISSRYRNRGVDADDLEQVALLGLTKAAQRFDPDAGHDFMAFAVPTIRGEVRRHFRDAGWVVRPPRRVQELQARITRAHADLEQQLGRSPRPSDVASHLDVDLDDVIEALSADGCFTPTSLDTPLTDAATTIGDLIGDDSAATEELEAKVVLEPLLARLAPREQRIVFMRFYEDRSQQEIADAVGLTQAQVSRLLRRILTDLRTELDADSGESEQPSRAVPPSTLLDPAGPGSATPVFRKGA